MEKAYPAWGSELSVENTAWELGLDHFIALEERNFIGRDALLAQRETGVARKLCYAEVDTIDSDIIGGEAVYRDGERIGVAISGAYGHRVGKSLAFLLLPVDIEAGDSALEIEVLGRMSAAHLLREPARDPQNRLPRAMG